MFVGVHFFYVCFMIFTHDNPKQVELKAVGGHSLCFLLFLVFSLLDYELYRPTKVDSKPQVDTVYVCVLLCFTCVFFFFWIII